MKIKVPSEQQILQEALQETNGKIFKEFAVICA